MHEYSIIQSLVDSVEAAIGDRIASVHHVEIAIGELAGVDCGLLTTAYENFREGTVCEHASLSIDRITARWECTKCGVELARGGFLRCSQCNSPATLAAGDEILLKRVELEVADVPEH